MGNRQIDGPVLVNACNRHLEFDVKPYYYEFDIFFVEFAVKPF